MPVLDAVQRAGDEGNQLFNVCSCRSASGSRVPGGESLPFGQAEAAC